MVSIIYFYEDVRMTNAYKALYLKAHIIASMTIERPCTHCNCVGNLQVQTIVT